MERVSKYQYYLNIAKEVSKRSTCLNKHWGAVIVKEDVIVSTGFNGAPRKIKDCMERGYCKLQEYRHKHNLERGTAYEYCISTHAEMNAIIFADKDKMEGSTLFLYGEQINGLDGLWTIVPNPNPCSECKKLIINAGIENVVTLDGAGNIRSIHINDWDENDIVGGY